MEIYPDFQELLELFNENLVKYMIVGGYALAFHGKPRNTGDIDIWVRPDVENAQRILTALDSFGFGSLDIKISDLSERDKTIQLGNSPIRIDLITSISGLEWENAVKNRVVGNYNKTSVNFSSLADLIKNNKASG